MGILRIDALHRYKTVAEICSRADIGNETTLLDIGGGTGGLRSFLKVEGFHTLDPAGGGPGHLNASMERLPLCDRSYDITLQVDCLEHIPDELRDQALREMVRVSRDWVIWVGPVHSELTVQVEEDLRKTHRRLFNGQEMAWLSEHRRWGLPDAGRTLEVLSEGCYDWVSWSSCSLWRWWVFGRMDLQLDAGVFQPRFAESVNDWYSTSGWKDDYRKTDSFPAYRMVFVGRRETPLPEGIDRPVRRENELGDWTAILPVIETIARPASLTPSGNPLDQRTHDQLARIREILTEEKKNSGLFGRLFGGGD